MTDSTNFEGKYRPRDDLGIEQVEADLLILDKRNEKIHKLNATASTIWMCLQEGRALDDVVQVIVDKFDAMPEVALQDVTAAIEEFRALGLLKNNDAS